MKDSSTRSGSARRGPLLAACAALLLSACGAGGDEPAGASAAAQAESLLAGGPQVEPLLATGTTTLQLEMANLPDAVAMLVAQPAFHAAPLALDEPDDGDAADGEASARVGPRRHHISAEFAHLSTRRLTLRALRGGWPMRSRGASDAAADAAVSAVAAPMATSRAVSTYSPAQIRAAYGLPALPAAGVTPSAAQAAQMGAGQTIYIISAMHDPNIAAELAAFNKKFGVPVCVTRAIAPSGALPLAAAAAGGCELAQVYSTAAGTMTSGAPSYDANWATESALDVEWAHATAPLARVILIEAPDASAGSLLGAVRLANAMGPGVVSMSFGADEGNWTAGVDSAFTGANMSYLAATGDSGAGVSWPSVSPNVVAVGGTTLTYSGSGPRSEVGWSGTGGGVSQYTPTPGYQTSAVPGLGAVARRSVADVAFNADPASGQYVAVIQPGGSTVRWMSMGGTSISTPQWAGLFAAANAARALVGKPMLGAPHALLYGQIATVPGIYSSVFADVTKGSDGRCATCSAKAGYDTLSGLGTPNVSSLLSALSGAAEVVSAPVVTAAAIGGQVGTALSFTVSASSVNPLAYSLGGAPAGMAIGATGVVTWATPVAGGYPVTVIARDTQTGLSGQGVYTVTIAAPPAPVVAAAAISGKVGVALSFTVSVSAPNALTYTLGGAPSGMAISAAGVVSWAAPVAGTYPVTVVARDVKTGLSGQGVHTVAIAAPQAPVVGTASVNGRPGVALSFAASVTASGPVTYALGGAPAGMSVSGAGVVSWASPTLGTYVVTVIAKDANSGLSGQGLYTVKIAAAGPVITVPVMSGVAGKPLRGTINISDSGVAWVSVSISGAPLGMSFSMSGPAITATWARPLAGSYNLRVSVIDSAGLSAKAVVPIPVLAK